MKTRLAARRTACRPTRRAGIDTGHVHVDVDAVQQGSGDALLVAADHGIGAGALVELVTIYTYRSPSLHVFR